MSTTEPDTGTERHETRNARKARERHEREERRARVAQLYSQHARYQEIADVLDISLGCVHNDVRAIRTRWVERSLDDYDALVAEEMAKLDIIERELLPRALRGGRRETVRNADGTETSVTTPNLGAVEQQLSLMKRRADLLGLDAPKRMQVRSDVTFHSALDEEIEGLLARIGVAPAPLPAPPLELSPPSSNGG